MLPARTLLAAGLAALVVVGGVAAAVRTPGPQSAAAHVTDAAGRAIAENGFNTASSSKSVPDGMPAFTEADLEREHADMGTNFVRFLISWRKVEPQRGVYDQAYLDDVAKRVKWYSDRGYHVMLDMHQDLWGPAITPSGMTGNGAPAWATFMDGLPVGSNDMWELYYLEPGVIRAFDNFWNTTGAHPDLMDAYADAWKAVAKRFADNDAVVAYDLMNEPYGGTMQGPVFEAGPLTELYQRTTDAIREVDKTSWVCLEPQAMAYNWGLPSGLRAIDDPAKRVAFCPHLYPLPLDLLGDGFAGSSKSLTEGTVSAWTSNTLRTAQALGDAPIILGEFGLDTTLPGALDYLRLVYKTMDASGIGTVYWSSDPGSWGPYETDGTKRNLTTVVDRAYPRAVAASVRSWSATDGRLVIHLAKTPAAGAGASEVYLPASGFPNGATVAGGSDATWDAASRILTFTIDADATTVTVTAR